MKINYIYQIVAILVTGLVTAGVQAQLTTDDQTGPDPRTTINIDPTDEQPGPDRFNDLQVQASIQRYADQVQQLEVENGAYSNDLVEELIGLGQAYANSGDQQEALNVFSRALHISRVNGGLQNMNQLPILELIIKTNSALEDYEALNDNFGYMLWVYSRNYPRDNMRLVPVYTRAANWHMQAYDMTLPPDSMRHLVIAANFFSKAVDVVEQAEGPNHPELIEPLYGIVNANFKLVEPYGFVRNIDAFIADDLYFLSLLPSNFDSRFDRDLHQRNTYRALDYEQGDLSHLIEDRKHLFSLIQNSYKSGRNALLRIIEIHEQNPELPALSRAYAHTHLADWYLRFDKRSTAIAHYEQAYRILSESEYADTAINELFGRPHSLGAFEQPPEFDFIPYKVLSAEEVDETDALSAMSDTERAESRFVLVQFNVTRYGTVRRLRILDSNPPDNVRFRRMALNMINSSPFRPRLEGGQPIETENVKMLYRFQ